jgi:hypothetical protein
MQVERALKLIASGTITIEMVQKAKGRVLTLPKQINQATGKASNQFTGFRGARVVLLTSNRQRNYRLLDSTKSSHLLWNI